VKELQKIDVSISETASLPYNPTDSTKISSDLHELQKWSCTVRGLLHFAMALDTLGRVK